MQALDAGLIEHRLPDRGLHRIQLGTAPESQPFLGGIPFQALAAQATGALPRTQRQAVQGDPVQAVLGGAPVQQGVVQRQPVLLQRAQDQTTQAPLQQAAEVQHPGVGRFPRGQATAGVEPEIDQTAEQDGEQRREGDGQQHLDQGHARLVSHGWTPAWIGQSPRLRLSAASA